MVFEFETTIKTSVYVDDDAGTAEVSNEVHCTVPLGLQAKNDVGSLVCAHIIDEMSKGFDDDGQK